MNANVRKLVSLTTAATHPPRRGQQVRTAGILGSLGSGWDVDSYSLMIQRTDLPVPRRRHPVSPRWTDHRGFDPLLLGWIAGLGRLGLPPVHASRVGGLLPHRSVRRAVRTADVVMIDAPYAFEWLHGLVAADVPVVLNAHNVESDLYQSGRPGWRRRFAAEIVRCESESFRLADLVLMPSAEDARRARELGARAVMVVPNGVDLEHFRGGHSPSPAARRSLGLPDSRRLAVFVGAGHPPNREAVEILERQAPAFDRAGISVVIVGRCGVGRSAVANVVHTGEVADVAPYLHAANVAVCPLLSGSGTSFKTLEFLAAGVPVVTTPVGARGLGLEPGRDAIVCDVEAFPHEVARIVNDPTLATMLANAGAAAVEPFSWRAVGAAAAAALDHLVESSR